ncbi:MAG: hypothetical protein HQ592_12990 [Planctomycetes bacterium]|nr:hypothetical protein [Planctomycetota bacterium]
MDTTEALKLIRLLADGIDPITGEQYPESSPYQNARIVRALYSAIHALEYESGRTTQKKNLPGNAGKPWPEEEAAGLVSGFDAGTSMAELAKIHQRTSGAIQAKLVKLGKIELPESGPPPGYTFNRRR